METTASANDLTLPEDVLKSIKELNLPKKEDYNALIYMLSPPDAELLTKPTIKWDFKNPPEDIHALALNMVASLQYHNGVGLSANQVGLPYSIFAMRAEVPFVCINPSIVWTSEETIIMEEACLSLPHIVAKINRPKHIKLRFFTPSGLATTKTFTGLTARIAQHEMEHLEGKFFIDGIGRMRMEKALKEAEKEGYNYRNVGLLKRALSE